jgi:hypothetical protein
MIGHRRTTIYIVTLLFVLLTRAVSSQRAIVSLGKRLQQRFSGSNKQHISDFTEGEKTKNSSGSTWYEPSITTFLIVVLGLYFQKRIADGGEFAI